jgi:hypothetical protein
MSEEQHDPSKSVLDLSTKVSPTKKFTVDGEEYEIYSLEHLNAEDEAKITAIAARHDNVQRQVTTAANERQAQTAAAQLRELRTKMIVQVTTLPQDIAANLNLAAQIQLVELIQEEMDPRGRGRADEADLY